MATAKDLAVLGSKATVRDSTQEVLDLLVGCNREEKTADDECERDYKDQVERVKLELGER